MKATGIVRRIDELGRVVIPKEIRNISVLTVADRFIMARDGNITAITAMTAGLTKENWMLILHQAYG